MEDTQFVLLSPISGANDTEGSILVPSMSLQRVLGLWWALPTLAACTPAQNVLLEPCKTSLVGHKETGRGFGNYNRIDVPLPSHQPKVHAFGGLICRAGSLR